MGIRGFFSTIEPRYAVWVTQLNLPIAGGNHVIVNRCLTSWLLHCFIISQFP